MRRFARVTVLMLVLCIVLTAMVGCGKKQSAASTVITMQVQDELFVEIPQFKANKESKVIDQINANIKTELVDGVYPRMQENTLFAGKNPLGWICTFPVVSEDYAQAVVLTREYIPVNSNIRISAERYGKVYTYNYDIKNDRYLTLADAWSMVKDTDPRQVSQNIQNTALLFKLDLEDEGLAPTECTIGDYEGFLITESDIFFFFTVTCSTESFGDITKCYAYSTASNYVTDRFSTITTFNSYEPQLWWQHDAMA